MAQLTLTFSCVCHRASRHVTSAFSLVFLDGAAAELQLFSASFPLHSRYDMYYVCVLYFYLDILAGGLGVLFLVWAVAAASCQVHLQRRLTAVLSSSLSARDELSSRHESWLGTKTIHDIECARVRSKLEAFLGPESAQPGSSLASLSPAPQTAAATQSYNTVANNNFVDIVLNE